MKAPLILFAMLFSVTSLCQEYYDFNETFYPLIWKKKWGYVNKYGSPKISPKFEEAFPFFEDLALVKVNGKYGFINHNGKLVIECKYDNAKSFSNGFAWVKKDGLETLIDHQGTPFMNHWFTQIGSFKNGFARVLFKNDNLSPLLKDEFIVAYINKNGDQLLSKWFSGGKDFENGKAKVNISGEYYFLDTLGRIETATCDICEEAAPLDLNYKIDKEAQFPGGDLELRKYIDKHIEYPKEAIKRGVQGKVYVKYAIAPDGKAINPVIEKGVHPLLDKAALEIIENLPSFEPALKDEKPVCSWQIVPILFQLRP